MEGNKGKKAVSKCVQRDKEIVGVPVLLNKGWKLDSRGSLVSVTILRILFALFYWSIFDIV